MNLQTAVNVLSATGERAAKGYHWRKHFLECVQQTDCKWCGYSQNKAEPELVNTATYNQCVEIHVWAQDEKVYARLTIYDGERLTGYPTEARCEFVGYFTSVPPALEHLVTTAFDHLVTVETERREQARLDRLRADVTTQLKRDLLVD